MSGLKVAVLGAQHLSLLSVEYTGPIDSTDSGYAVLFTPDPDPEGTMVVWCLHCLIEKRPEVGRGLDLAREYGAADLVDGEWVGRSLDEDDEMMFAPFYSSGSP